MVANTTMRPQSKQTAAIFGQAWFYLNYAGRVSEKLYLSKRSLITERNTKAPWKRDNACFPIKHLGVTSTNAFREKET